MPESILERIPAVSVIDAIASIGDDVGMTRARRLMILLVSGVIVAGLLSVTVAFGLRGVEAVSWVAGSASLVVTVAALIASWPAARRDGTGEQSTGGRVNEMATGYIDQLNSDGISVANTGRIGGVRIASATPELAGQAKPAADAISDSGSGDDLQPAPGAIRQRNIGGTNVASSGTIGSIDISHSERT